MEGRGGGALVEALWLDADDPSCRDTTHSSTSYKHVSQYFTIISVLGFRGAGVPSVNTQTRRLARLPPNEETSPWIPVGTLDQ